MLSTFWAFAKQEKNNKKKNENCFKKIIYIEIEKSMPELHLFFQLTIMKI